MLQLGYDPEGLAETVGDKLGFVKRQATGDLRRFKQFIGPAVPRPAAGAAPSDPHRAGPAPRGRVTDERYGCAVPGVPCGWAVARRAG